MVTEVGIAIVPLSKKHERGTLLPWHCIALWKVAWVYQAEENDHSFQWHTDRVWPAFKKWYNFSHRNKIIANQVQAYSFSLASPSYSVYQIRYWPGGCSNEHVRVFASAMVTKVGITIVPLSKKHERGTLLPWHRIPLWEVAWVYQIEENDHSFQLHADRVWPALKKWYNFSHRNKIVANQAQAYSPSVALPPCSVYQIWYSLGGC